MNQDQIIQQALALIETDGHDDLSLRGLARELGVSAPALYEHVDSKDHLLRLVAQNGYDELGERWGAIEGSPRDWLLDTGRAYVCFAVERPALFALMHRYSPAAIVGDPGVQHPAASTLFDEGLDHIRAAIEAGDLRDDDPLDIAIALWSAAHGVATVSVMIPDPDDPLALADRVIGGLLDGLKPA
ncbi:MAG: TetR/AcrR family transcriptional regulator [Actinomycetota bacterium]